MLSKGQKINERYEIVKSIGEGGMANVYLAQDSILSGTVPIAALWIMRNILSCAMTAVGKYFFI